VAADGSRLDDVLAGTGPWLITRDQLGHGKLEPFHDVLAAWFDKLGVTAVLVRPDRHVFGSGLPEDLTKRWEQLLHPEERA
jgi:3-(3-hydroxy-phenyl)propionate hydroxylase